MLNGLDLFSGIGGLAVALEPWVRPIAYCENDRYAQGVLLSRMQAGTIGVAPVWDDVQTFEPEYLSQQFDIVYGGFPCQDISAAGHGAGLAGERSGLFFQLVRIVEKTNPSFVFLENVPAIRTRGLAEVISTFSNLRYDCRWTCVSAAEIGATHLRKRWFFLAYTEGERHQGGGAWGSSAPPSAGWGLHAGGRSETMANANGTGFQHYSEMHEGGRRHARWACAGNRSWWDAEPGVGRVANGVSNRVDRIRCMGNAVVPLQARTAFARLMGLDGR